MILIADSGSTKTDWLLQDAQGGRVDVTTDGINPFYIGEDDIFGVLREQLLPELAQTPGRIFYYGTGCAGEASSGRVARALARAFPGAGIEVYSDLTGAARALCGRQPGMACILGTGSNNSVYDGAEVTSNIGSLGFWLGDEGSGGHLGKTLLVHYLHRELPEPVHQAFRADYPEIDRLYILEQAYRKPFPNRYFAAFTPFVSRFLSDAFVAEMVRGCFTSFVEKYVLRHPESAVLPVHFTGSVAWYFREVLLEVVAGKKLTAGRIERSPLPGLLRYHAGDPIPG